ncbi:MAG: hypothetical protein WD534_03750 [Phycisphaeraceae bacterium]
MLLAVMHESEAADLLPGWPEVDRLVPAPAGEGSVTPGASEPSPARYDAVLASETYAASDERLREAAAHLDTHGVMAITCTTGRRRLERRLRAAELFQIDAYGLLPAARPWLFVPLRTTATRAHALTCHTPSSLTSSLAAGVARGMSRAGLVWPIARRCLVLATRSAVGHAGGGIVGDLAVRLEREVKDVVVMGRDHRTIMLLLGTDAQPIGVAKLAGHDAGREALAREAEALRRMACSPLAAHAPQVMFEGEFRGLAVQVQSYVPAQGRRGQQRPARSHYEFLASMTRVEPERKPLEATTAWRDVTGHFSDQRPAPAASAMSTLLARCRAADRRRPILCHRTHGDFTPWNIRTANGRFMVIDWEESEHDGMVGSDLLTFVFRQAACVGPWRSAAEVMARMDHALLQLLSRIQYDPAQAPMIKRWWLLWEHLRQPTQRQRLEALAQVCLQSQG